MYTSDISAQDPTINGFPNDCKQHNVLVPRMAGRVEPSAASATANEYSRPLAASDDRQE
jgi:hypothetical protein